MADLGSTISLNASKFAAGVAETRAKLTELNTAFVENKNKMKELNKEAKDLQKQERELANEIKNGGGTAEQREQLRQLRDRMAQVNAQIGQLRTQESELRHDISQTNRELQQQRESASSLSSAFESLGQMFESLGIAETCRQIAGAFMECVKAAEDFEATMSVVEALSGASASQMEELTAKAKELGAATKFTATESAQAMTFMGMAGWNATQMLDGMDGVLSLAAASGTDLATTSDIITDSLTAFGLKAEDTAHFADVLAAAATNSNTNVEIMGETFKNSASVAGALGYSIEDVSTAIGLMANAGVKGTIAGTALKHTFEGLVKGVTLTSDAFGEAEVTAVKADGTMKSFGETIDELRGYFSQMTEAEKMTNAIEVAGKYGFNGLLAVVNSTQEDFDKLSASINDCTGAAKNMSNVRMDNLQGQVALMDSAMDALKNTIGSAYQDELRELAKAATEVLTKVNEFLAKHPTITKAIVGITTAVTGLVGAFAAFATVAAAVEAVKKFTAVTQIATTAQQAFNLVAKANPYILLASAIAGVVVVLSDFVENATDAKAKAAEFSEELKGIAENSKTAVQEQKELENIASEYDRITNEVKDSKQQKEELAALQERLNALYGDEKTGIDLVNGKYDEQRDILAKLTEVEKAHLLNDLNEQLNEAQGLIASLENQQFGIEFKYDINSRSDEAFADALNEIIDQGSSLVNTITGEKQQQIEMFGESGIINISSTGDIETQITTLEALETAIMDTGEANGRFAETFEAIGQRLTVLRDAKARSDEVQEAFDRANGTYKETEEAIEDVTDAVSDLEDEFEILNKIEKDNDDLLQTVSKDANALVTEYTKLYDSVISLEKGETLSYDKLQDLIAVYPELANHIQVTADGYAVEENALNNLREAVTEAAETEIQAHKDILQAAIDETQGAIEAATIKANFLAKTGQMTAEESRRTQQEVSEALASLAKLKAEMTFLDTIPGAVRNGTAKPGNSSSSGGTSGEKSPPGSKQLLSDAKSVSAAFKEQKENGELALSTVQALIDAGYEEALVYDEAADKWSIDAEKFGELWNAEIEAAKGIEGVTGKEIAALDSLGKKLPEVTAGVYGLKEEVKALETADLSDVGKDMKELSEAFREQEKNGGKLDPETAVSLQKNGYGAALVQNSDGSFSLQQSKVTNMLQSSIQANIAALEERKKAAKTDDEIREIDNEIAMWRTLGSSVNDVTQGIYGYKKAEEELPGFSDTSSSMKSLSEAFAEQLKNGALSGETVEKLIADGWGEYLNTEGGVSTLDASKVSVKLKDDLGSIIEELKAKLKELEDAGLDTSGVEALIASFEKLGEKIGDVTAGTYGLDNAINGLGSTDSEMSMLSGAFAEQNEKGGLSISTYESLKGTKFAGALTVDIDGNVKLDPDKIKEQLNGDIDDQIKELEEKLKTAEAGDIPALKVQLALLYQLRDGVEDVTEGLYNVDEKLYGDESLKKFEAAQNRRLKQIDNELAAKKKLRDETLKAIDDEVQARKRLTEDNDIERQMQQVSAQLKYSQLDEFSRAQLERKLQQLEQEKSDKLWERGVEDRKAAVNEEYDSDAEKLNSKKEAINNSLSVLRELNNTTANGFTGLEKALKEALENVSPGITNNITLNSADKMTEDQLARFVENICGSTAAI